PTTNPTDDLPLVMELLSSGRLTIFTNKSLEKALADFLVTRARARDAMTGIESRLPDLDGKHGELYEIRGAISTSLSDDDTLTDEFFVSAPVSCDEERMRAHKVFLNDLANFEFEYQFYNRGNQKVSAALAELHNVLDEILGDDHQGDE
ncbi:MAG: hypothetical protein AAF438_20150, partial [Pseudomonadota bacterium]